MTPPDPERIVHELVAAWNAADRRAFGLLFTADAHYVTGDGAWLRGRKAIEALVPAGKMQGLPITIVEDTVATDVHGEVATAVFRWASSGGDPAGGVITCVMLQERGTWRVARLQNTDIRPG